MQNSLVQIEYILNKFLLKGRDAIGRMRGKKEKGEEKEGRLQERKQGEQHRNLGSHLFPVCNTCQGKQTASGQLHCLRSLPMCVL